MRIVVPYPNNIAGGVERFLVSMVPAMARLIDQVLVVLGSESAGAIRHRLQHYSNVLFECSEGDPSHELGRIIERHDATHCLYPFFSNGLVPPQVDVPLGGVIHDLYWWKYRDRYHEKFLEMKGRHLQRWLRTADTLFTVSQQTLEDVCAFRPEYRGKLHAVLHGADVPAEPQTVSKTHRAANHPVPVFYYPATLSYMKNHSLLMHAMRTLLARGRDFKLVLTGRDTEQLLSPTASTVSGAERLPPHRARSLAEIETLRQFVAANSALFGERLEIRGYCSPAEVADLYASADCVILPSSFEGFGLPLSEAICHGAPVICSDIGVFREQIDRYRCQDRVTTFPDGDLSGLILRIEQFLDAPARRLGRHELLTRFSHWGWSDVGRRYVELLAETSG